MCVSQFWSPWSPRSKHQQRSAFILRPGFLACKQLPSHCEPTETSLWVHRKGESKGELSGASTYKDSDPMSHQLEDPPPLTSFNHNYFLRGLISEYSWVSTYKGFPGGSDGKASAYNVGDQGSIPESGRSPGEGNDNPLQYFCLENPMDGGAWEATVHGVAKSRTRLSDFSSSPSF